MANGTQLALVMGSDDAVQRRICYYDHRRAVTRADPPFEATPLPRRISCALLTFVVLFVDKTHLLSLRQPSTC